MKRAFLKTLAVASLPLLAFGAAPAGAQGQVSTLERGSYVCELPGDAAGRAGLEQKDENFTIASASRYSAPQGSGTYLRRGDTLEMTSGPRLGDKYQIYSERFLRKMEGDTPSRLRCVRSSD